MTRPAGENPAVPSGVTPVTGQGWVDYFPDMSKPASPVLVEGHANLNNVDVHDFYNAISMFPNGSGAIEAYGPHAVLNLSGHTKVENNVLNDLSHSLDACFDTAAGVSYYIPHTGRNDETSSNTSVIGPDVVISNNQVQPASFGLSEGVANRNDTQEPTSVGGLFISGGSKVNVDHSTISNNIGDDGGGVWIGGITFGRFGTSTKAAMVNIHGAKITGNTATITGGGALIDGSANVAIDQDTQITGNKVGYYGSEPTHTDYVRVGGTRSGGGLAVTETTTRDRNLKVTVDGANISNNVSADCGGGVYVNTDGLDLKRATINNNSAVSMGGGIYVSSVPFNLHLGNAAIYGNKATDSNTTSYYYFNYNGDLHDSVGTHNRSFRIDMTNVHPLGHNQFRVTVISDSTGNQTTGTVTASGNNLATSSIISFPDPDNRGAITSASSNSAISNCFIGGSGGGVWLCPTGNAHIEINNGWAIFDNNAQHMGNDFYHEENDAHVVAEVRNRALGGSDANWVHDRDDHDGTAFVGPKADPNTGLRSNLTQDGKDLAKALATVTISGNTACWGGGIGSNGGLYTSLRDDPQSDRSENFKIVKSWSTTPADDIPDSVKVDVDLTVGSNTYHVTTVTLKKVNNWTYTLTDMPTEIDGQPSHYDFKEETVDINNDGQNDFDMTARPLTKESTSPSSNVDVYDLNLTNKMHARTATINIIKHWSDTTDTSRPTSINVKIYKTTSGHPDTLVKTVILNSSTHDTAGDWTATVTGLDVNGHYKIVEEQVNGYQEQQTALTPTGSDKMIDNYTITLTNKKSTPFVPPVTEYGNVLIHYVGVVQAPDGSTLSTANIKPNQLLFSVNQVVGTPYYIAEGGVDWPLTITVGGSTYTFERVAAGSDPVTGTIIDGLRNVRLLYVTTQQPTQPTQTSQTTQPTSVTQPTQVTTPTEPTQPSTPITPTEPTQPTTPLNPTQPTEPQTSKVPVKPGQPTAAQHGKMVQPVIPAPSRQFKTQPKTTQKLPQTGNNERQTAGLLSLGLMTLAAAFGFGRRKRE